jgi:hypothetical protein
MNTMNRYQIRTLTLIELEGIQKSLRFITQIKKELPNVSPLKKYLDSKDYAGLHGRIEKMRLDIKQMEEI